MKLTEHIFAISIIFLFSGFYNHQPEKKKSSAGENQEQEFCSITNSAFVAGEQVTFHVFYSVAGAYFHAGNATFTTTLETYNNRPVYHVVGEGKTKPSYDKFYKVRDRYETYIDTASMQPLRFIRDVNEGGYKKYETVTFSKATNTAITKNGVFPVPECVQDVLSAMYFARNVDFNKYKPEDKIPFKMFLDDEIYNMYIRYLGKDTVKTQYGRFKAIKFKPYLIKGTIFEGGEKMQVWISDDPNRVLLRVESPIVVGKVKIDMMAYRNLRYPLSSMIKLRGR
jgi:hypothetical protein